MSHYIVNTFITQRETNIDNAISFYSQKTNALLNSLDKQAKNDLTTTVKGIEGITEIFNNKLEQMKAQLSDVESFYNKKITGMSIQKQIQEYNKHVQSISDGLDNGFNTIQFLNYLQKGGGNIGTSLPQTIDLSSEKTALLKMAEGGYKEASAAGGARARIVGEMVEQILLQMVQDNCNDLFATIRQAGSVQTQNYSGKVTKGKSDLLFSTAKFDFTQLEGTKATGANIGEQTITLDLEEAVDLENTDIQTLINEYTSGVKGQMGGMTIKQWTDNVLGKRASTIAHSTYTQNLINSRYPGGQISQEFASSKNFQLYVTYVVSRFLINIIGAYNILVGNASGIETTASWLQRLKNGGYALQHSFKMINSIPTVEKNTIFVGRV